MNQYPVILAFSSAEVRAILHEKLAAYASQFDVAALCGSAEELRHTLRTMNDTSEQGSVVFTEFSFLDGNADDISEILYARSQCVLVMPQPEFHRLLTALRLGACDCLEWPVEPEELADCMQRLLIRMRPTGFFIPREVNSASRYLFWHRDLNKLSFSSMTMEDVNQNYGTHFSKGLFRGIFIEIDSLKDQAFLSDEQLRLAREICLQFLKNECFDVLTNRHTNGISLLINHADSREEQISRQLEQMFLALRRSFDERYQVTVTMSISRICRDFSRLPEVKQEMLDARWYRKSIGMNQIISADAIQSKDPMTPEQERRYRTLCDLALHYCEMPDIEQAVYYIDQIFENFWEILPVRQIRVFTQKLLNYLFEIYADELRVYGDCETLRQKYIKQTAVARDNRQFQQAFVESITDLLQKIERVLHGQYSEPVRNCIRYITGGEHPSVNLEAMAQAVGLSPQYLSSLFHKETGLTISEFISRQKIGLAQNMLTHSSKNINEIADELGFCDSHYFSRFFKRYNHVTPSGYRRIAQAKAAMQEKDAVPLYAEPGGIG